SIPQTALLVYSTDTFTSTVPAFAATTFNALPGIDPNQPFTFNFNQLQPNSAAQVEQIFLVFTSSTDANAPTFSVSSSATSFSVPAGSLQPNTVYTVTLRFRGRINGTSGSVQTIANSDVQTSVTFGTSSSLGQVSLEKDTVYIQNSAVAPTAPTLRQAIL